MDGPGRRASTLRGFYRLLVGFLMQRMAALEVQPYVPVLFVLEEMAMLRRMQMIEEAFGQMAG
ncbi:MAG: hypothetical protein AAFR47_11370 [Pseudomonadota bacterium]